MSFPASIVCGAMVLALASGCSQSPRIAGDTPEGRERARAARNGKSADGVIAAAGNIRAAAGGQAARS